MKTNKTIKKGIIKHKYAKLVSGSQCTYVSVNKIDKQGVNIDEDRLTCGQNIKELQ